MSEYTKILNEFTKSTQGNTSENEQIAVAINQIIENLKEPWLTSKESTQITLKDINNQISQLEGIKQKLVVIDNAEAKKTNSNTRTLLLDLIKDTDALTSELGAMKDANFDTRNQLGTQFGNIHMAFAQYLNKTTAFYESYKTGK